MRLNLLTASLLFTMTLTGCADHAARIVSADPITQTPIGPSDGNTIGGGGNTGGGAGGGTIGGGGNTGGGAGGGNTGGGGTIGGGGGSVTSGGSSVTPSNPLAGGDGVQDGTGGEGALGGTGGSPVPEPGTMLLVGTGLAGAALMRRRRQGLQVENATK